MMNSICKCIYSQHIDIPVTPLSIVLGFLFSFLLVICGLTLNYRYRKKLQEEKRNRPLHRKGNVIEPIMRWYLLLSIFYWPFSMVFIWIMSNEIIPSDVFKNCNLLMICVNFIRIGRIIIAYNSFFVCLIRYVYIVHHQKANQWNFENVGRRFQIASVTIPLSLEIMRLFVEVDLPGLKSTEKFQQCMVINENLGNATYIEYPLPRPVAFTMQFMTRNLVDMIWYAYWTFIAIVGLNITEGYFYLKIYQTIKRSVDKSKTI